MGWLSAGRADEMAQRVRAGLGEGSPPVVALAPGRVNLIGEHTDYNRGLCLPVALPHATYVAARPREAGFRIRSAQSDDPWTGDIAAAGRAEGWAAYAAGVLWALSEAGFTVPPADLYVDSTVPLGAGLSSSAALECAVATAFLGLTGTTLDDTVRVAVAQACIRAETEVAGAPTGGMDQLVALFGTRDHALLLDFDTDARRPIPLATTAAGLALLVIDTRVSHALIDGGYASRRTDCETAAAALGMESLREAQLDDLSQLENSRVLRRARHIVTENDRVTRTAAALESSDWSTVGELMIASHASMRDDFEISCPELDLVVETALEHRALGARMTGGGFGGSAVALIEAEQVDDTVAAISGAADRAGHPQPGFLLASPSDGARLV